MLRTTAWLALATAAFLIPAGAWAQTGGTPSPGKPARDHRPSTRSAFTPATAPALPFDAKVGTTPRTTPPPSTLPDPGQRVGLRVGKRAGGREGDRFAQRLGGGSDRSPVPPPGDPRDRLESKRTSYDTPR